MADERSNGGAWTTYARDRLSAAKGWRLAPDVKVLVSIASLLGLLAVAILAAVLLILDVNDDTTHLTDRQVEYATAIYAAALNAKGIANDERGFLLSGNPEFIEELDVRTGNARAAFLAAANAAEGRAQREAVAAAHAGFERWVQALRLETATFEGGDREKAVAASLGPTRALRKTYEKALARAQTLGIDAIQSGRSSVSAASSRSVAILIGYLVVALSIGIVLAAWIVRTVLRPVRPLLRLATATGPEAAIDERDRQPQTEERGLRVQESPVEPEGGHTASSNGGVAP